MAVSYNLFYVPNNFVTGGVSGLAIVLNEIGSIPISAIIFAGNVFFIILSLAVLGLKKSINNVIGAFAFSLFVYLTEDICSYIYLDFSNNILDVLCAGLLTGIGAGLVYKVGFTSGGTDILTNILNEKVKISMGNALMLVSAVIMIFGSWVFGFEMLIYALIIKYIESIVVDKILLGISDSKMIMIESKKEKEIKEYLIDNLKNGVTIIKSKGGYTSKKSDILMCVVPTSKYYKVKEAIKEIDENAFIIISDCYEVYGGTKKRKKMSISKIIEL